MTQPDEQALANIGRTLASATAETSKVLAHLTAETAKGLTTATSEMQTTLALLKQSVDILSNEVRDTNSDHESRIRKLEDSDRRWAAFAIVASVLVTVAVKLLWP